MPTATTCPDCGGDGFNDDATVCETCVGQGCVPVLFAIPGYLKQSFTEVRENFTELKDWCIGVNLKLQYLKEKIDEL